DDGRGPRDAGESGDRSRCRSPGDQRVERPVEHVHESVPGARSHTRISAHLPARPAGEGSGHRRRGRARPAGSDAHDSARLGALPHRAKRAWRSGGPRRSDAARRAVGRGRDPSALAFMTTTAHTTTPRAAAKSVDDIRSEFPALQRLHRGVPVAYFDGPGGTQVPTRVATAMTDYLFYHNANTHWRYATSQETDALILQARTTLAEFLNGAADEIAFGQNMMSLTFHLARSIGRRLGKGDEILITELDHHANVAPWRAVERERGVTIRTARLRTEDGRLDWADFESKLTPATRVVAIGAASNALGTITDVQRATKLAHAVGALAFVDAVHYA